MAKNSITDYDNTSGNNTDVQSVDISEGCSPSGINNAIREVMADLADVNDGTVALTSPQAANMTVTGTVTTDTIAENTSAAGVTIDGVLLKDGGVGSSTAAVAAYLSSINGGQIGGNRNLIINGAMQVAQRGTSESALSTFDKFPCVDRFQLQGDSSGTFTISQSTTAPEGFANSLKIDCTTADASPNYLLIGQIIEGQNVQHLKKGTSNALSTTVSFYVRSSKTGTYQLNIRDNDNSRLIGSTYTINSADTWEYKVLTFAGDTSGTLDNDNGYSLRLEWWLASGSTYNSGAVPTAWEALSNGDRAAGLTANIGASTSDDFYITGVQLEVGEQATPFEHRSYGDELARCQRYYLKRSATSYFARWNSNRSTTTFHHPVDMRASPTLSYTLSSGSTVLTSIDERASIIYVDAAEGISLTDFTADAEL